MVSQKEHRLLSEFQAVKNEIEARWNSMVDSDSAGEVKQTQFNLNERVFNLAIRNHFDDIDCLQGLQLYWEKPWGGNLTVRLVSTRPQFEQFASLVQFVTNRLVTIYEKFHMEGKLQKFEVKKLRLPKNLLRKLVGYQEKALNFYRLGKWQVDFYYDDKLLVDTVFPLDDFTFLRIFGRSTDVAAVSQMLLNKLECICTRSLLILQADCNFVMQNVKEIKSIVNPCEIRIKQMDKNDQKDLRHPFLFLTNYLRDVVLIGTISEIEQAEKEFSTYLKKRTQSLSFLMPVDVKDQIDHFKELLRSRFSDI